MKNNSLIKVGFLLSYDYDFLKTSIPLIYKEADTIVLAKDEQCRTWSGNTFTIADEFFKWIKDIDSQKKIKIYEDNFYLPELSLVENDTRERNMLADHLGKDGGWHVQLDADEYIVNFKQFVDLLKSKSSFLDNPEKTQIDFSFNFHVLYKRVEGGFLYVDGRPEIYPVATNYPNYIACRKTNAIAISTGFDIIHHTWARKPDEVRMKLNNWTHAKDFNTESYFKLWDAIDKDNYKFVADFHPMIKGFWPKLGFLAGDKLEDAIKAITNLPVQKDNALVHAIKSNYWLKKILNKH